MDLSKLLTGKTDEHIEYLNNKVGIHQEMKRDFLLLQEDALKNNINLQIASGYRSFNRQELIWNEKNSGQRPIYDATGIQTVNPTEHSPEDLTFYILRWSALPGMSRHHWGTDIDIFDQNALPSGKDLKLIPSEYEENGPMSKLYHWLKEETQSSLKNKFYFPYCNHLDSYIAEEKWHLSYIPLCRIYEDQYTYQFFINYLKESTLTNKEILLENASLIYEHYFRPYFSTFNI